MLRSDESGLSIRRYLGNVMGGSVLLGAALAAYASWLLLDLEQRQNQVGRESLRLLEIESAREQVDVLLTSADLAIGSGETYTGALAMKLSLDLREKFSRFGETFPSQYLGQFERLASQLELIHSQLLLSSELSGSGRVESLLVEFDASSLALVETLNEFYGPYRDAVLAGSEAVFEWETVVKRRLLSVFLVYVMLNLLIILWSLQRIALPIELLTSDVERSINHNREFKPSAKGPTEIWKLADFFTRLTESLNRKVKERTATLENRTRDLETEITVRLDTEAKLKREKERAERSAKVKSEFLSVMSHELRTPLNVVISCLEVLRKDSTSPHHLKFINLAQDSGESLTKLIGSILETSKIESGELELASSEFDLSEEFDTAVSMTRQGAYQKGLDLVTFLDPNLPQRVVGDALRWRQVVTNLIDNAVKYTESGRVEVTLRGEPSHTDRFTLSVRDTGAGIDPKLGQTVFDGFTQADSSLRRAHSGVGLGLKICREIAIAMGGECNYTSQAGSGSKFWFSVPLGVAEGSRSLLGSLAPDTEEKPVVLVLRDENKEPLGWLLRLLEAYDFMHEVVGVEVDTEKAMEALHEAVFSIVAVTKKPPAEISGLEPATARAASLIHLQKSLNHFEESVSAKPAGSWRGFDPSAPLELLRALFPVDDAQSMVDQDHTPESFNLVDDSFDNPHPSVLLLSHDHELHLIVQDYLSQANYGVSNLSITNLLSHKGEVSGADLIVLLVPKSMDETRLGGVMKAISGLNTRAGVLIVSQFRAEQFLPEHFDIERIRVLSALPSKAKLLELASEVVVAS